MEQGNLSNVEWLRGIGEYKIECGPGLRIYLTKDGLKLNILLGGGTKERQRQDIDQALAEDIHKPAKSLHRMLSKAGNPTMSNISAVFAAIKRALKVEVRARVVMA